MQDIINQESKDIEEANQTIVDLKNKLKQKRIIHSSFGEPQVSIQEVLAT